MNIIALESIVIMNFLAFVRVGVFFSIAPVFTFVSIPVPIRVLLSGMLAVLLLAVSDVHGSALEEYNIWLGVICEVINGSAMAFGMLAAFAVFHFAGRVLDFQLGMGIAGLIDPSTQTQAPLTGTLLNMLAIVIFILSGGVALLMKVFVLSFEAVPPGQVFAMLNIEWFLLHFGLIFSIALILVAPVLVAIFMLDVLMAFAGRTMPQMNVFIISIPFKIAIGLVVIASTITAMQPLFRKVFESIFQFLELLLNG